MKDHLEKIDLLRGLAAFMVFIFHCQYAIYPEYSRGYTNKGFLDIPNMKILILNCSPSAIGGTGVELFLIISGFLIHLGYLKNKSIFNIRTFYSKRFWRIYPPYFFVLIFLTFSVGGIGNFIYHTKDVFFNFITHVFLIHNLFDSSFFTINGSFWTLGLEMQLYFIYPILLYSRIKFGMRNTFVYTLVISILLTIVGIRFHYFHNPLAYTTSCFSFWFVWSSGAYYAELYKEKKRLITKNGLLISTGFFLLMMASRFNIYTNYLFIYFATLFYIVFIDWLLYNTSVRINSPIFKFFASLGLCSYSFYLIHQPYLSLFIDHFSVISKKHLFYNIFNIVPAFIILYLVSYSLYNLLELNSIKYGNILRQKKLNRQSPQLDNVQPPNLY